MILYTVNKFYSSNINELLILGRSLDQQVAIDVGKSDRVFGGEYKQQETWFRAVQGICTDVASEGEWKHTDIMCK